MSITDYIATGLNMMDKNFINGECQFPQIGGITLYGYCGMRVFTDSIHFLARVGNDFFDYYNPWFSQNDISTQDLLFVSPTMPSLIQNYGVDGAIKTWEFFTGNWKDAELWRPKGSDVLPLLTEKTKGFYISCGTPPDETLWDTILRKKNEGFSFKIMWEPNGINTQPEQKNATLAFLKHIEMASFSLGEGLRLFGLKSEKELLSFLQQQPPEFTILRVGKRGLYTITHDRIVFIPSAPLPPGGTVVDTTGCGNASTAAACYGWCEGNDDIITGIMANVASSYNLLQKGPYPQFSHALTRQAMQTVQTMYNTHQYEIMK